MATFTYRAINASGLELSGEVHAPDRDAAREQLRQRGLIADSLAEQGGASSSGTMFKAVKPKSLQVFSRQFATMIGAGLSVVTSLVILEQQTDDRYLAEVLRELRADVEGGLLLSQAMARHPKVFSRLYVAMVEAGEAAGILDQVLDRVAIQIEKETQIKRRVKGAMIYPSIVLTFAFLVLTGLLLFLVPVFQKMFTSLGGTLPRLTQIVITMSTILRHDWYIVFPLIIATVFGFRYWKRTPSGQVTWDRMKLHMPAKIGDVVLKISMARFARTLSTLVSSGVDIMKALEITAQTSGNKIVEESINEVRVKVHEGVPMGIPMSEDPIFPAMVSQMVKIGEETGALDDMLDKVADFYEDEVDASVQSLTSIIEPLMMVGVGIMVGVIIISMYMPMFKLLTLVK